MAPWLRSSVATKHTGVGVHRLRVSSFSSCPNECSHVPRPTALLPRCSLFFVESKERRDATRRSKREKPRVNIIEIVRALTPAAAYALGVVRCALCVVRLRCGVGHEVGRTREQGWGAYNFVKQS